MDKRIYIRPMEHNPLRYWPYFLISQMSIDSIQTEPQSELEVPSCIPFTSPIEPRGSDYREFPIFHRPSSIFHGGDSSVRGEDEMN